MQSRIANLSDKAFNKAVKSYLRDPTRPINFLDFMTLKERRILIFQSVGLPSFEKWLKKIEKEVRVYDEVWVEV